MTWRYVPNLRAQALQTLAQPPWETPNPRPECENKVRFREWSADARSEGVFFTAVEAVNQGVRVSLNNPAFKLHGFVADWDAKIDLAAMKAQVESVLPKELRPRALCQTFSGYARAV